MEGVSVSQSCLMFDRDADCVYKSKVEVWVSEREEGRGGTKRDEEGRRGRKRTNEKRETKRDEEEGRTKRDEEGRRGRKGTKRRDEEEEEVPKIKTIVKSASWNAWPWNALVAVAAGGYVHRYKSKARRLNLSGS